MTPRLNAVSGALAGQSFVLDTEPLTVGRDRGNALHLRDLAVSRRHCVIETSADGLLLRDLGSSHGTFVNGVPVTERILEHGDLVSIGSSLFLVQAREEQESGSVLPDGRDQPWMAETTVHLSADATVLLRPEAELAALPPDARSTRDLQALLRIGKALHEIHATVPLARRFLELALETVPAERAALLLLDPTGALPVSFALDRRGSTLSRCLAPWSSAWWRSVPPCSRTTCFRPGDGKAPRASCRPFSSRSSSLR